MKIEYSIKEKEAQLLTESNLFEAFSSFEHESDTIELTIHGGKNGDVVLYIINIDTVEGAFLVHSKTLMNNVFTKMGYDQLAEEVYDLIERNFYNFFKTPTFNCRPCKSKIVFYD